MYNHTSTGLSFQNNSTVYFTMTPTATNIDTSLSIGTISEVGSDTDNFLCQIAVKLNLSLVIT